MMADNRGNVTGVDHGFSGPLAAAYRRSQDRIAAMANPAEDTVKKKPEPKKKLSKSNALAALGVVPAEDISSARPTRPQQKNEDSSNIVEINNDNIPFDISYPEDTKLMSVGMNAMSVDISDDSVSILIKDEIRMKLPKLVPLHLVIDEHPYKVCWAGGIHKFGKFKHISFVIVD